MLILIAGVSGNFGKILAKVGLDKGHRIRGFGRSPSKLPSQLLGRLESFVSCESYDDTNSLDEAVNGVDAVICSYVGHATAVLESQLSLLRAAERADVKVYHALSWNSDWRKISMGDFEHYDASISFCRHVELTSSIKPVYVFTGIFGEFAVNTPYGICSIRRDAQGINTLTHWANGDHKHDFTYMEDAASFSIDLITTNESVLAGTGGFFQVHSSAASAKDIAKAYKQKKGEEVQLQSLGSLEELASKTSIARATTVPSKFFSYTHFPAQRFHILGTWKLEQPEVFGGPDATERLFDSQISLPEYYQ